MNDEIEKSGVEAEKNIDELLERFKKVLEELEELEQEIDDERKEEHAILGILYDEND